MALHPVKDIVRSISSDFFYPFFSLVLKIENIVSEKALTRNTKKELVSEISSLKKNNNILSAKCEHLETLINENNELRKLLKVKRNPYYNYIFAEIIYRDPLEWFREFTVNKGDVSGIEIGAVVLARIANAEESKTNFAVLGRVESISKHTASISTVLSDECNLSVIIPENGATGILSGGKRDGNRFWTKIEYLPRDLSYKPSSRVVTSGMNMLIPSNLPVGKISGKNKAGITIRNKLYAEAVMEPAVDLNHLKFVLILVKRK